MTSIQNRLGFALVSAGVAALLVAYLPGAGQRSALAAFNQQAVAKQLAGLNVEPASLAGGDDDSQPGCDNCAPPEVYRGGSVVGTTTPGELTVTPVYWAPPGYTYPAGYTALINQYVTDIAADSGKTTNVFAVNTEYSGKTDVAANAPLTYLLHAGTPLTDATTPFPAGGCTAEPGHGYTACVTDTQLKTELTKILTANNQVSDLAHLYVLEFPPNVQTVEGDIRSLSSYCGIHSAYYPNDTDTTVYADEPFIPENGCGGGESPNNNPVGDLQLDTLSHEINEVITDPASGVTDAAGHFRNGYQDGTGNEVGDECSFNYGPPLGSADPANPLTTYYNQVINGHKYYTQTTFSNKAYAAKKNSGCIAVAYGTVAPRAQVAHAAAATDTPEHDAATAVGVDSTVVPVPNEIPADGVSTSEVTVSVTDDDGQPVAGDHVHFLVHAVVVGGGNNPAPLTQGDCGTLGAPDGVTDEDGDVTVTYTSSTVDVACLVLAVDNDGGFSNSGIVYQGTTEVYSPDIAQTHPVTIVPGAAPVEFTTTVTNSSPKPLGNIQVDLYLSGDDTPTTGIDASQVHLQFKDDTTVGYVDFPLDGTTVDGGVLQGTLLPDPEGTLAQGESHAFTFRISLDAGTAMTAATTHPLQIETDVDQINPASGSVNNLEYAGPDDVVVAAAALPFTAPAAPAPAASAVPAAPASPTLPFTGSTASPWLLATGLLGLLLGVAFLLSGAGVASQSRRNAMLVRLLGDRPQRG